MKFSASGLLTVLLAAATVGSVSAETNAERFARGLPPLPPRRRSTPTYPIGEFVSSDPGIRMKVLIVETCAVAKRGSPSSLPNPCTTGTALCCGTVYSTGDATVKLIAGLLGLDITLFVGLTGGSCTPLLAPLTGVWCVVAGVPLTVVVGA